MYCTIYLDGCTSQSAPNVPKATCTNSKSSNTQNRQKRRTHQTTMDLTVCMNSQMDCEHRCRLQHPTTAESIRTLWSRMTAAWVFQLTPLRIWRSVHLQHTTSLQRGIKPTHSNLCYVSFLALFRCETFTWITIQYIPNNCQLLIRSLQLRILLLQCPVLSITSYSSMLHWYKLPIAVILRLWFVIFPCIQDIYHVCDNIW